MSDNPGWTDERIEELKRLWAQGLSASQVAKKLGGTTRGGICGKIHRLGLAGRGAPTAPGAYAKPDRKPAIRHGPPKLPKPRLAVVGGAVFTKAEPRAPKLKIPENRFSPLEGSTPKVWTERAHNECTWPVGGEGADTLSCCNPISERSWCAGHMALGTVPVKARNAAIKDFQKTYNRRFGRAA